MTSSDAAFTAAISEAADSVAAWAALDRLAGDIAGHSLFTVTLVDVPAGLVRRAYSSRPAEYPTSGTKPLRGNAGDWFEAVFNQRRTFVANTIEDIAKVFPDHQLIGSLGCGAEINLPIVLGGQIVATVNLLDAAGRYTPSRVAAAESGLAIPARLCCALAWRFDAKRELAA
jgi:hypothetical protein